MSDSNGTTPTLTTPTLTTPTLTTDPETGRPIAAVYKVGGGTCIWFGDGLLPAVKHVVTAIDPIAVSL